MVVKQSVILESLAVFPIIDKAIIESLEQTLYRLVIEVNQQQYYVLEREGLSLTRRSIVAIQELLIPFNVHAMYLQHQSPYDEMIGQDINGNSNALLVRLGHYFNTQGEVLH